MQVGQVSCGDGDCMFTVVVDPEFMSANDQAQPASHEEDSAPKPTFTGHLRHYLSNRLDLISWFAVVARHDWVAWLLRARLALADLATHFIQFACLVLLLLWLLALLRRRWRQALSLMISGILLALPMTAYVNRLPLTPDDASPQSARSVQSARVVVWNVLSLGGASNEAIATLLRAQADVAILIEFSARNRPLLPVIADQFPHQKAFPNGSYGIAVVSRWPMQASIPRIQEADNLPIAVASVAVPGWSDPLQVIGIHTLPPNSPKRWEIDRRYIGAILARAAVTPEPLLVAGDWNAAPTSFLLQQVSNGSGLRLMGSRQPTWGVFSSCRCCKLTMPLAAVWRCMIFDWRGR